MASESWVDEVVAVLDRAIGLDAVSISPQALHQAIRAAYAASGFSNPGDFLAALERDARDRQALIERVVVKETWFLRDHAPFELLARHATRWMEAHATGVLRVLSAPCATGEEAYSIAIALLDAGVPAERFAVIAVDVSELALDRARRGVYSEMSLRKCPSRVRERYFVPVEGGVQVTEQVRRRVTFEWRNLTGPAAVVPSPPYDVVFCRNLLIYLHEAARRDLCRLIDGCLAQDGLLVVGHAEVMPMCETSGFVIADSRAFALVRAASAPARRPPAASFVPTPPMPLPRPTPPAPTMMPPVRRPAPEPVAAPDSIQSARLLADQGRLSDARQMCERVMAERGPSDETFFLLGVIEQAEGRLDESAAALRKALYLNPSHRDALVQLAVLHDRRGDRPGADRLRQRAARVDAHTP